MKRYAHLKMNKLLFVGYSITISIMTIFLTFVVSWALFVTRHNFEPAEIVPQIISLIPALLMLEAIPLAIFTALFLKKGGGLNYFETWNAGMKPRVSGILILMGYTAATIPALIGVLTAWSFRSTDYGYDPMYMSPIYLGLYLMVCGLVAFVYLWITHHKKQTTKLNVLEN